MHCHNCGALLPDEPRFCANCGAPQQLMNSATPALAPAEKVSTQHAQSWPGQTPTGAYGELWARPDDLRADDFRRFGAATRSFTTPAIITLVLYFVMWLPGFIANIVYWEEASNVQRITGRSPEGKGCLAALFWVFTIFPAVMFLGALLSIVIF